MKKIEKMIHQIIRFRGKIEAFLVSIEEFSSFKYQLKLSYINLCVCFLVCSDGSAIYWRP